MDNLIGLDLGNRYGKVKSEMGFDELLIAWKEIDITDYNTLEILEGMEKVKYKNKYYIVGLKGVEGIDNPNKGNEEVKEMANMVKLVLLARDMRKRDLREFTYKAMTGTPYDDFDKYYSQYINLMKSPGEDFEVIELNGEEYKIKVDGAEVTKQGACVVLTLPNRKSTNYLIFDWGGGTLDVSYFENGVRIKGQTFDFSLNEHYVELGKELNKYIDITRPAINNATFMKDMETLKLEGNYKGITTIKVNDTVTSLKEYVSNYFQNKVDKVILQVLNELKINNSELNNLTPVHVGGGAKLLINEIINNKKLPKCLMTEQSEYRNVIAYYEIAKLTKSWK